MYKLSILELLKNIPNLKYYVIPQDIHDLTADLPLNKQIKFINNKIENYDLLNDNEKKIISPILLHLYNDEPYLLKIPEDLNLITDLDKKYLISSIIKKQKSLDVESIHLKNIDTTHLINNYSNVIDIDFLARSILDKEIRKMEDLKNNKTNDSDISLSATKTLPIIFSQLSLSEMMEMPDNVFSNNIIELKNQMNEFDYLSLIIKSWKIITSSLSEININHPNCKHLEDTIVQELNSGLDSNRIIKFNTHIINHPNISKFFEVNDFFFQKDEVISYLFNSPLDFFQIKSNFWTSIDGLERIKKNTPKFLSDLNSKNPIYAPSIINYYSKTEDDIFYRYLDIGAPLFKMVNELNSNHEGQQRLKSIPFYEYTYNRNPKFLLKHNQSHSCPAFFTKKAQEILKDSTIELNEEQQSLFMYNILSMDDDTKNKWFERFIVKSSFNVFNKLNIYEISDEILEKFQNEFHESFHSWNNETENTISQLSFSMGEHHESKNKLPIALLQKILNVSSIETKKKFFESKPELLALPAMKELQQDIPTVLRFLQNNQESTQLLTTRKQLLETFNLPSNLFFNKAVCLECINSANQKFIKNIPSIQFNDLNFLFEYIQKMEILYPEKKLFCENSTLPESIKELVLLTPENTTVHQYIMAKIQNEIIDEKFKNIEHIEPEKSFISNFKL